jgi:hypothetical protein
VRDVVRSLSPVRFSFFVVLAGAVIFLLVQQGTEILRGLAERNPDKEHLDFDRLVCFYAALLTWALYSWYLPRVLLPKPNSGSGTHTCQRNQPLYSRR